MSLKKSKNPDEVCYPFIQESSCLCDYEVITDELCTLLGMALSALGPEMDDIATDLEQLQPLAFHANGSIRGRLAVDEADLLWLEERLNHYRTEVAGRNSGFVLPRGDVPIPQLHQARSASKKAIRALVRVDAEGIRVPEVLPRLLNMLCNFSFVLTQVINQRRGVEEPEFISKSYAVRNSHQ
jgi:ATP:cob(I)alamin adenosyltransferase